MHGGDYLDHFRQVVNMDELADDENLSWAAYHASCNQDEARDCSKSQATRKKRAWSMAILENVRPPSYSL